jgi:transcription antitermination factor NusG
MKHKVGDKVEITSGSFKGQRGTVQEHNGVKVVVLPSGVVLHGINDKTVKKV